MKTFFNVLYRRILYKIPLKLLLILLAVFCVLFASFSKAENVSSLINYTQQGNITVKPLSQGNTLLYNIDGDYGIYCLEAISVSNNNITNFQFGITYDISVLNSDVSVYLWKDDLPSTVCLPYHLDYFVIHNLYEASFTLNYKLYRLDTLLNTEIPVYSSMQCQTEYNLIPISFVDQNYCTTNNLCPTQECPDIPVWTGEYSQLYINNILHLGAPNIIMNIPDEIDWDYAYTAGGQNMNIDVVGYNVDYEKIDSIVQFQNYKPTSEDFQKIIGLLAPYTKIIVFFVFLFIVWAWIKKPFKSKKL